MLFPKGDMNNIVEDIVTSYEGRLESMDSLFNATCQFLGRFHDSFPAAEQGRQDVNVQVREILARYEHLRKKDFDNMVQGILSFQDEREREVRDLLRGYLSEQKEKTNALRKSLAEFRFSLAQGEVQRVSEFRAFISEFVAEQEKRKEEVVSRLKEFQKEQQETAQRFRGLLNKGRDLRIKDLKSMLKEFKLLRDERLARREERRAEIRAMLDKGKKKRISSRNPTDIAGKADQIKIA